MTEAQALVNSQIPDFVPFLPQCRLTAKGTDEPGLKVYREHFIPSGVALPTVPAPQKAGVPNDGPNPAEVSCTIGGSHKLPSYTLGGTDPLNENTELGGDAGGTIVVNTKVPVPPGPTQAQP